MRMSGNGFPEVVPQGESAQAPAGHGIDCRLTNEEKDGHYDQERAEHKAQHPRRRHIAAQKARAQVAERHPTLLGQKHNRQDAAAVRIRGKELIGGVARIQAQQPEGAACDQDDEAQEGFGGEAEQQADGGKSTHGQRNEVVAGVVRGHA